LLLLPARRYLIAHSTGTVTIAKAMMGRQKKEGNQFPPSNKIRGK
jgi:predicted alpha/beta hydrolase family esterase